jgi:hypothetical protein
MQCNAMQCNAMQCNAMQCNAMQCSVYVAYLMVGAERAKRSTFTIHGHGVWQKSSTPFLMHNYFPKKKIIIIILKYFLVVIFSS